MGLYISTIGSDITHGGAVHWYAHGTVIADYQCRQILGDNYFRLAPVFPPDVVIPFDGVKRIPELVHFAESGDVSKTVEWLKTVWK